MPAVCCHMRAVLYLVNEHLWQRRLCRLTEAQLAWACKTMSKSCAAALYVEVAKSTPQD